MGSGSWIRILLDRSGIEKFGSVINIPDPQHWFLSLSIFMRLVEEQCPGHGELNCPQENPWLHEISPVGFAFSTPTALPLLFMINGITNWNYWIESEIGIDLSSGGHRWTFGELFKTLECRNFFSFLGTILIILDADTGPLTQLYPDPIRIWIRKTDHRKNVFWSCHHKF